MEPAERRLITPCRILPGYEPTNVPNEQRYLTLPDDTELHKLQQEDDWCKRVIEQLQKLNSPETQEMQRKESVKALAKLDIPPADVERWFVEPNTQLLMREGYVLLRPPKTKPKGDKKPEELDRDKRKRIVPQRVIPVALRAEALYAHHGHITAGHRGVNRVRESMARTMWWPKIGRDIRRHIEGCKCPKGYRELRQDRPKLVKSLLQETQGFGEHISIDCSGIGPETRHGNRVFLVIVDTFSLYTRVVALPAATALEVARALIHHWFSAFGLPLTIHSDSGPEFHNALVANIAQQLQIHTTRISPGNPSGNSFAENAVKKVKKQIGGLIGGYYDTWDEYAPLVTWTYNDSYNARTQAVPSAVAFGRLPRGIVDLALPPLKPERTPEGAPRPEWTDYRTAVMDVVQRSNEWVRQQNEKVLQKKAAKDHDGKKGYAVQAGHLVWLYNPVNKSKIQRENQYRNCWTGPFMVHSLSDTGHTATLQVEHGRRLKSVNVRHLRRYQSPLMAVARNDPQTLAAIPTGILAFREREEGKLTKYEYLVQLHTDTAFQDWLEADLLPRSMVLEWWRLLDENPHLRGLGPGARVVVMMPDRGMKLCSGYVRGRSHNLLDVCSDDGQVLRAYVSPSGIVRSADRTTEVDGRRRDAAARRTGPTPVASTEAVVPVDPEEGINSSDIHPAVVAEPTRVTRSGAAGLRTTATPTTLSVQTMSSTVATQESAEPGGRLCGALIPEHARVHSGAPECAHAARLAPQDREINNPRHEERHMVPSSRAPPGRWLGSLPEEVIQGGEQTSEKRAQQIDPSTSESAGDGNKVRGNATLTALIEMFEQEESLVKEPRPRQLSEAPLPDAPLESKRRRSTQL